jgi:hypothetical protein
MKPLMVIMLIYGGALKARKILCKYGVIGNVSSARTTVRRFFNKRNSHCRNALNITLANWCLRSCAEEEEKKKVEKRRLLVL